MKQISPLADKECFVRHKNSIVRCFSCQVPGEPRIYDDVTMALSEGTLRSCEIPFLCFSGFQIFLSCEDNAGFSCCLCPSHIRHCAIITIVTMGWELLPLSPPQFQTRPVVTLHKPPLKPQLLLPQKVLLGLVV